MTNIEITNAILKTYIKKDYDVKLQLDIAEEEDGSCSPQMQVTVMFDADERYQFAFFGPMEDEKIYMSAIYELKEKMPAKFFKAFQRKFAKQLGEFKNLMYCDKDDTIHLYGELEQTDDIEGKLANIEAYFTQSNELLEQLKKLSFERNSNLQ